MAEDQELVFVIGPGCARRKRMPKAIAECKNRAVPSSVTTIFKLMNPQETQTQTTKTAQGYSLIACVPGDLSDTELATCVEIVKDGGAVAIGLEKLQKARMLAVARKAGTIVGVGSIKRDRPDRAADIANRSGFGFPQETPELGYVAVAPQHRRQGLSHQLVGARNESGSERTGRKPLRGPGRRFLLAVSARSRRTARGCRERLSTASNFKGRPKVTRWMTRANLLAHSAGHTGQS